MRIPLAKNDVNEANDFGQTAFKVLQGSMKDAGTSAGWVEAGPMHADLNFYTVRIYLVVEDEAHLLSFLRSYPFTTGTWLEKTTTFTETFPLKDP
jgi:hypothetical protein